MSLAFLFPGQGARNVLAGLKLARSSPLLDLALDAAKLTLAEVESHGGRALERTEVLQPVLTAICLAIHATLRREGLTPAFLLGHSLGELSAYAAAGVFTDEAAVKLAALRGALMAREAAKHPGGLLALPSLEVANSMVAMGQGLQLAAVNAPDEVVVGGSEEALRAISALTPGRRVPVSGAWHCDAMAGAVEEFRAALRASPLSPMGEREAVLDALADQLAKPVQFTRALATARAQGVDTIVTVGPGAVIRGLVRKNLGTDVRVLTTEDAHDLERTCQALLEN